MATIYKDKFGIIAFNSEDKLARIIFYGDYSKANDALKRMQEEQQ